MSEHIPVYIIPLAEEELPDAMDDWLSMEPILSERYEHWEEYGIREITSSDWCYQEALQDIVNYLRLPGLDFILQEISCLGKPELSIALNSIDTILLRIADGLPDISQDHAALWWLRHDIIKGEQNEYSPEIFKKAFDLAQPSYDVSAKVDVGFDALVGFYSSVKTLRAAIADALDQDKYLVYAMAQP